MGINELRSVRAIPPLSVFEDIDALYISHFHLDHLRLLGALPPGTKVYVPTISMLKVIEEWYRASPTWMAELPHKLHTEVIELKPYREDELGVIPIPVSHSAYPADSFIYRGHNSIVFYSGDLRVDGPLGPRINTLENIEKVVGSEGIDIGLLEGTNIGEVETPVGSDEFRIMVNKVLMSNKLVIVSIDPVDFEMFTTVTELASLSSRTIVIASPRLVDVLPQWYNSMLSTDTEKLAVASEIEKPALIPVNYVSLKQDVLKDPDNFLLIQEPIGFLEMLRRMKTWGEKLQTEAISILTMPEPLESEAEIEEKVLTYWLNILGVHIYRIRISGHYYPHELRNLLEVVKPRKLIPIHTKHPSLVLRLAKQVK